MAEVRPLTSSTEYSTAPPSMFAPDTAPLEPPRASYFSPGASIGENSPRDSYVPSTTGPENDKEASTPAQSAALLPAGKDSEGALNSQQAPRTTPFYRRPVWLALALGALVALILIIILPLYFTVIHKSGGNASNRTSKNPGSGNGNSTNPNGSPKSPTNSNAISGADGSTIISGNTSFTYRNSFGGTCEFFLTSNHIHIGA